MSDIDQSQPSRVGRGVVFISHEKSDAGLAHEIRTHLEAGGFEGWMAPDDIRGPTPWQEQVERAIGSCDVMLVVVSANSSGSQHVSREVDLAVEKGKPMLPVRVEDVAPTGTLNYLLRLAQWIDLFPGPVADHAGALQSMVGSMLQEGDGKPATTPPAAKRKPSSTQTRRNVLVALAAVALIAVGIGIGSIFGGRDDQASLAPGEPTNGATTATQPQPDNSASEGTSQPVPPQTTTAPQPQTDNSASQGTSQPTPQQTATTAAPSGKGAITRVSVASDGTEGNDHSLNAVISGDGRYVAFDSAASNLVEGDSGRWRDVFVHDRETGATVRVSEVDGTEANGSSRYPRVSGDGRYVVFASEATNLDPGANDSNDAADIYLHDRETGLTRLISRAPDGSQHTLNSIEPSMSDDGTLIAYATTDGDATPPFGVEGSWTYLTWVFDGDTATTSALADLSGLTVGHFYWPPLVARDGTAVISGDAVGGGPALVLFDQESGQTASIGTLQGVWLKPVLAPEGRSIVFSSELDWFVADDINAATDTFSYDLQTGEFRVVADADAGEFVPMSFSSDGRYLALANSDNSVLLLDTMDGSLMTIPRVIGTNITASFELSGDGRWGSFSYASDNLVDLDSNGKRDVFVMQLQE